MVFDDEKEYLENQKSSRRKAFAVWGWRQAVRGQAQMS